MKKSMLCGFVAVCGLILGLSDFGASVKADENAEPYEVAINDSNEIQETSLTPCTIKDGETFSTATNCRYHYRYRYYRPVIYYRPVCYYYPRVYTYTCYYSYRYVVFYNGVNDANSDGDKGFLMEKTPETGTPLAKLGVKKGDIITKINGKAVKSTADIDNVTENSTLSVLKNSAERAPSGSRSSEEILSSLSEKTAETGSSTLSEFFSDL